jgi:hypothetical protein
MSNSVARLCSFVLFITLLTIRAQGQAASDPSGLWVFTLGEKTLLVLRIARDNHTGTAFAGSLTHPEAYQTQDSTQFAHIVGKPVTSPITASLIKGNDLFFTVSNPVDPTDKDDYSLHLTDAKHAQLQLVDFPIPPMLLNRGTATASVSTDWDTAKTYTHVETTSANDQLKRIFMEDQAVRQQSSVDWPSITKLDAQHRSDTSTLLAHDLVNTAQDYFEAAVIFQHGVTSNDFLLAHTLAIIAVQKGNHDALWIASASLDRYLRAIGQPQIYGTQFRTPPGEPVTQEPYNRTLVSDALRMQLGVPTLAEQKKQGDGYGHAIQTPDATPGVPGVF